jgi:hypothetical protein
VDESLLNISERIKLIDAKLTSIGKTLNGNIIQNIIIFLLSIIAIFATGIAALLPPLYDLTPEKYLQLVPVAILYSFVQFGFVSLRGLHLMAERDKLTRELGKISPIDLQRLRIIFRSDSFLEVFYKTLIFDGEEPTKIYKAFVIFWIILIVCGNTVFLVWFMIKNINGGNAVMAIFLVIAVLTSIGAYRDYWFKAKKLRAGMVVFFKS